MTNSTYIKPTLAKFGNSNEVIKGACGFGAENIVLNKTGATKKTIRKWVLVSRVTLLAGPWVDKYECRDTSGCSTQSHECSR
ncbi:hypothetical protein [Alkalibaculum bacchi]|uniref:hypothetical protein n=1 Tax=Alkalibaculum bacchi TaxID=645887 RepID=UPI0026EC98D0|nr:hypothetical protein [Alkalibaculum bacchi]